MHAHTGAVAVSATRAAQPPKRKLLGNLSYAAEINPMSATENLDNDDSTRVTPLFIRVVDLSLANAQNEIGKLQFERAAKLLDKAQKKLSTAPDKVEQEVQRMLIKQYIGDEQQCRVRLQALVERRWRVLKEHRAALESRMQLAPLVQSPAPVPSTIWFQDFGLTTPSKICPTDSNLYLSAKLVCVRCGVLPLAPSAEEQRLVFNPAYHHQGVAVPSTRLAVDSFEPRNILVMRGNSIVGYACWQNVADKRALLLRCVAITPRYRRLGVGKASMEHMLTLAQGLARKHGQPAPHTVVAVLPRGVSGLEMMANKLRCSYGFMEMSTDAAMELLMCVAGTGERMEAEQVREGQLVCLSMNLPVDDSAAVAAGVGGVGAVGAVGLR